MAAAAHACPSHEQLLPDTPSDIHVLLVYLDSAEESTSELVLHLRAEHNQADAALYKRYMHACMRDNPLLHQQQATGGWFHPQHLQEFALMHVYLLCALNQQARQRQPPCNVYVSLLPLRALRSKLAECIHGEPTGRACGTGNFVQIRLPSHWPSSSSPAAAHGHSSSSAAGPPSDYTCSALPPSNVFVRCCPNHRQA